MNKRLFVILFALLALIGTAGAIVCTIMFVMAIRFGELGRVIFYFMLAFLSIEVAIYSLFRLVKSKQQN